MEKELKIEIFLGIAYLIGAMIFISMAMVVGDNIWIVIDIFYCAFFLILMMVSVIKIITYYKYKTRDLSFKAKQRLLKQ